MYSNPQTERETYDAAKIVVNYVSIFLVAGICIWYIYIHIYGERERDVCKIILLYCISFHIVLYCMILYKIVIPYTEQFSCVLPLWRLEASH